uniref:Transcription factor TFIIB cyclin-like domain-containing protein n=1 Tax=Oryza brachyantha TaxID=4533 RepID=J3LKX5_ORYBR
MPTAPPLFLRPAARVDSEAGSGQDNTLLAGFLAISDMADRLAIGSTIRDRAKELFKKLEGAKLCKRGQHRDTTYAACLDIACRNQGKPRTLKELASVISAGHDKKEIRRMSKIIRTYLGEEAGQAMEMEVGVVCAADYMVRFSSQLGIAAAEVRAVQRAAQVLDEKLDVRRSPESLTAAIIYMVAQRAGAKTSARDVSTVTGVAEATIKEATKELNEHAELLFS